MAQRRDNEIELWSQLSVLVAEVGNTLDRKLTRQAGVGLTEFLALNALSQGDPSGMRMQQLAEALGLNQSSVSRLVGRLQELDLAERGASETDRRGVLARITDEGRKVAQEASKLFSDEMGVALHQAGMDGRTAAVVARLRYSPEKRGAATAD
jgi:DNA-binding MarR family transcriptional regulator